MAKQKPVGDANVAKGDQAEAVARATAARVKVSGKTTRQKGHLSASTRRSQAKRDGKNV